ncbi:LOW QUALITY PROTEIN: izumo sperm-egg fusion protein 4 [Rhynchonycteris naso]
MANPAPRGLQRYAACVHPSENPLTSSHRLAGQRSPPSSVFASDPPPGITRRPLAKVSPPAAEEHCGGTALTPPGRTYFRYRPRPPRKRGCGTGFAPGTVQRRSLGFKVRIRLVISREEWRGWCRWSAGRGLGRYVFLLFLGLMAALARGCLHCHGNFSKFYRHQILRVGGIPLSGLLLTDWSQDTMKKLHLAIPVEIRGFGDPEKLDQVANAVYQKTDQLYQGKMYFPGKEEVHPPQNTPVRPLLEPDLPSPASPHQGNSPKSSRPSSRSGCRSRKNAIIESELVRAEGGACLGGSMVTGASFN